jgi:CRISPR/Cas system-associated exonuclease Cas4 (RecB family)
MKRAVFGPLFFCPKEHVMEKMFESLVHDMSEALVENRNLEYSENAVGITSLLYCPRKVTLRKEHPEIKSYGLEIDDGFLFENQVKNALYRRWPQYTVDEYVALYESKKGPNVEGHVDVVVQGKKTLLGIECKHTKILEHNLPYGCIKEDDVLIKDPELVERIYISPSYIEQAAIQKHLMSRQQPKSVKHYLFIKTMMNIPGLGYKKMYILRETREKYTDEKLDRKIDQFCTDPRPRFSWECAFCAYRKHDLCEGVKADFSTKKYGFSDLDPKTVEALERYEDLYAQMVQVEDYLKKALQGKSLEIPGKSGRKRKIGWVEYTNYNWDLRKVFDLLGPDILGYLQVNWWKIKDLEGVLAESIPLSEVRTSERVPKWKGFIS